MDCRADLLSLTRALVDGVVAEDPQCCTHDATFEVVVQLAPRFEVCTEVCTCHQLVIEANMPGTRSLRIRRRAA